MPTVRDLLATTLLASALVSSGVAGAQTSAPVAPSVTPTPTCDKPGEPPALSSGELGKSAAEARRVKWMNGQKAYLECLKTFISDEQAAAAPHIRASNAAVEEFNKAIAIYNGAIDAAKQ